jgi:hypothetical protein
MGVLRGSRKIWRSKWISATFAIVQLSCVLFRKSALKSDILCLNLEFEGGHYCNRQIYKPKNNFYSIIQLQDCNS